jgi:PAS domain S-box-containing protein
VTVKDTDLVATKHPRRARRRLPTAATSDRLLFEANPDALIVVDDGGRILDVNEAACVLLAAEHADLCARDLASVGVEVGPEGDERAPQPGRWRGELELIRPDGSHVPVEAAMAPAGPGAFLLSARDATERRRQQRTEREFISLVGHELRNPIASLKGYAQLMRRRAAYSEEAVDTIVRQTNRLNRLVGDLLDASRLQTGRLELRRLEVDLVARARAVVEGARELTTEHAIRLEAPDSPILGWWDRDRLEQVLDNLVGNAVKYSPGGEIVVRIEPVDGGVRVLVVDQGPGIAPEVMPFLFERFYRAESAAASPVKGLGLGLYVCKGLVEAMGGRIWVESDQGHGSTFVFVLPAGES